MSAVWAGNKEEHLRAARDLKEEILEQMLTNFAALARLPKERLEEPLVEVAGPSE